MPSCQSNVKTNKFIKIQHSKKIVKILKTMATILKLNKPPHNRTRDFHCSCVLARTPCTCSTVQVSLQLRHMEVWRPCVVVEVVFQVREIPWMKNGANFFCWSCRVIGGQKLLKYNLKVVHIL